MNTLTGKEMQEKGISIQFGKVSSALEALNDSMERMEKTFSPVIKCVPTEDHSKNPCVSTCDFEQRIDDVVEKLDSITIRILSMCDRSAV